MKPFNPNLRAVGHQVLIMPLAPKEKSEGGIHLPEQYAQPRGEGTIISLGGKVNVEGLKYGAWVFFNWLDRRIVQQDGKELWLIDARTILGVVI